MLRRCILFQTNTFINCRYVSQSMLQCTVDEKSGIITCGVVLLVYFCFFFLENRRNIQNKFNRYSYNDNEQITCEQFKS